MGDLVGNFHWLLIWVKVTCLYEQLLKLHQFEVNVLVLAQKRVLIVGVLELLILDANVPHCSFHLLLNVFHAL